MLINYALLVITSLCWGITNVFIKKGSQGVNAADDDAEGKHKISQILTEFKYLLQNWKYIVPFVINQIGSVIYVYALQKNSFSVAVILVNSLTLLFTSITSIIVENKAISYRVYLGAILITLGSSLCVINSN